MCSVLVFKILKRTQETNNTMLKNKKTEEKLSQIETLESYEKIELIWDLKLEVELLHRYLEQIFDLQDEGDRSKVRDWDLNGSIRHIKRLNSQNKDIKELKDFLLDEKDRRMSLGIWRDRNWNGGNS